MEKYKNFNIDNTFKPIELFSKEELKKIKKNKDWRVTIRAKYFLWWNVSDDFFEKEIEVGKFLAWAISRWYTDEMLKKWIDFFGKDLILEAAEKYKEEIWKKYSWIFEKKGIKISNEKLWEGHLRKIKSNIEKILNNN